MLSKFANSIAFFLAKKQVFGCEYAEVYRFGLELIFSTVLNLLTVILIGVVTDSFIETIIFLVLFVPLRFYSGGYHASTYLRCFLGFCTVYGAIIAVLKITPGNFYQEISLYITIISSFIIITLSPVKHENHLFGDTKKKKFKKIAVIITLTEVVLILEVLPLVNEKFQFAGALTICSVAVLQLISLLKMAISLILDKIKKRGENDEKTNF